MADTSSEDIGKLRHRLTYQTPPTARNAMNQFIGDWTTAGTHWAHVRPLVGMELMNARQKKSTTSHMITVRNFGPINTKGRFLFEATGRVFGIDSVFRVDERNAYYSIHCTEQDLTS